MIDFPIHYIEEIICCFYLQLCNDIPKNVFRFFLFRSQITQTVMGKENLHVENVTVTLEGNVFGVE